MIQSQTLSTESNPFVVQAGTAWFFPHGLLADPEPTRPITGTSAQTNSTHFPSRTPVLSAGQPVLGNQAQPWGHHRSWARCE